MKYNVTGLLGASTSAEVEADSVDEAIEKAYSEFNYGLCHQCAGRVDTGDVYEVLVCDESGDVVYEGP